MKVSKIIVLAGVMALFMIAPANAALSPNLIQNSNFTGVTLTTTPSSGNFTNGVWYRSTSAWTIGSTPPIDGPYALLGGTTSSNRYLFQSVEASQVWSGHTATAGPVEVSFYYFARNLDTANAYVTVYGSNSQPYRDTSGNYHFGSQLGDLIRLTNTYSNYTYNWVPKTVTFDAPQGYLWYTILINGDLTSSSSGYLGIDSVSVKVTPIPPAAWLLGTGLLGLIGLRRKFKK